MACMCSICLFWTNYVPVSDLPHYSRYATDRSHDPYQCIINSMDKHADLDYLPLYST